MPTPLPRLLRTLLCCAVLLAPASAGGTWQPEEAPPAAPAEERETPLSQLTFQEALRLAEAHSPRLEAARHERRATEAPLEREKPGLRPVLSVTAGQTLQGPRVTFPRYDELVTVVPTSRTLVGLTAHQPLFRFGAGAAGDRYRALREAASATYEAARHAHAFEVAQAYHKLAGAREMARVAAEGVELASVHVRLVQTLLQGEVATRAELLRAEAGAAEADQGLSQARNGVALAHANLERLLGRALAPDVALDLGEPPAPLGEEELKALVERAQEARPEVRVLRSQLQAAEAGVSLARSQALPSVQLDGAVTRQTRSAFVPSTSWSAGVTLTIPILDGGKARGDVAEARARADQLRATLRELQEGIALEVRQAASSLAEARERRAVASKAVEAAAEAHEIARLRYEKGVALNVEVLDAQLALTRARANRAQAALDLSLAGIELAYRSGTLAQ